ncbi:MAG: hybrid sensor histidine kinase/response regulator [Pleurocapsa minor GSE-CHR-MK-17-07R]|jgi:signal transduction histidine kinase|nr:hybrid sensor histidine kinase/response regulator [Pleurocapsa minor GSE-CHR-MK 17-07R]
MSEQYEAINTDEMMAGRGQLLIVDDEEEILKSLRRQFRRDYDVYTARSAEEAYRILLEHPIQVIISDQRMPEVNGSEFFSRMKDEFPDAVRLLLTGYADIQAVISAINDGQIFRYITKPWDPQELNTIVREAFHRFSLVMQSRRLYNELREANALLEERVKERTTRLEELAERLRTLVEQRDSFIGMAAHDLRTPIQVVQGFTDLLLHPKTDPTEYRNFVLIIQETMHDMLNLLNNLLDITAIESGKIQLNRNLVRIDTFVERVARDNRMLSDKKGIFLDVVLEKDLPQFRFDAQRIEQVLNNFLSNAFKFSESGSTVTISVRRLDGEVEFRVIDQGMGIRPDEITRIFNEFQRTSNKPTGSESSTGLGLSIARKLVELHEGRIGVKSQVGKGSSFYFTLPTNDVD